VRHVDRSPGTTTDPRKSLRNRLQAVSAGAALAFMAGLAGAGAQMDTADPATTDAIIVSTVSRDTLLQDGTHLPDGAMSLHGREIDPTAKETRARAEQAKADRAKAAKAAVPSGKDLHPRRIPGGQQSFNPSKEQLQNAKAIVDTGKKLKMPPRAWVIAVATATQESTLRNLGHLGDRNDHDSQGLFQQRPSAGWGSPKQITNPEYASTAFYNALKSVEGYETMPLTEAAQTVQYSAYPNHYAKWEKFAGDIVLALHGEGPYAEAAADLR